jgi:hypothetical protein
MFGHGSGPIKLNANMSECVQAPIRQFDLSLYGLCFRASGVISKIHIEKSPF